MNEPTNAPANPVYYTPLARPEPKAPLIYLALAAIMKDIEAIAKSEENKGQGFTFRGIEQFLNELHPVFRAHGVICVPRVLGVTQRDAGITKGGAVITRTIATFAYQFIATDGSMVEAQMLGEGLDSADKATPKAASMALKYALMQTFLIPTADVVEADYYSPTVDAREEIALRNRDRASIQAIIDQHLADAEIAENEGEKKRLMGLAAELRCKLADFDVTPTHAPPPVATPAPAPEPEKPKEAPAAKPKVVEAKVDQIVPPAGPTQQGKQQDDSWKNVECHLGKAGGAMLGKKVGDLIKPTHAQDRVDSIWDWAVRMVGNLANPSPKDTELWDAFKTARNEWLKANEKTAQPKAEEPKPSGETVTPTDWREFIVPSKLAQFNGRKLGDMSTEELHEIDAMLAKVDWTKATLSQRTLRSRMALAMAEQKEPEKTVAPEHTRKLIAKLTESGIKLETFVTECKKAGWIPDSVETINDVSTTDALQLLSDWGSVEAQCDTIPA